jgi:hypothetical protein
VSYKTAMVLAAVLSIWAFKYVNFWTGYYARKIHKNPRMSATEVSLLQMLEAIILEVYGKSKMLNLLHVWKSVYQASIERLARWCVGISLHLGYLHCIPYIFCNLPNHFFHIIIFLCRQNLIFSIRRLNDLFNFWSISLTAWNFIRMFCKIVLNAVEVWSRLAASIFRKYYRTTFIISLSILLTYSNMFCLVQPALHSSSVRQFYTIFKKINTFV